MVEKCDSCNAPTEGYGQHQYKCEQHTLCYPCGRAFVRRPIWEVDDCEGCLDTWRYTQFVPEDTIKFFFAKSRKWRELFVDFFDQIEFLDTNEFPLMLIDEVNHLVKKMRHRDAEFVVESERKDAELQEKDAAISDSYRTVRTLLAENEVLRSNAPSQVNSSLDKIRSCEAEILRLSTDLSKKEEKINSSLDQIGTCEAKILRLSTDLREKEEKVNSSLGKIETCEAEIHRLATVLRKKESIWGVSDSLRSLAESIHGTFRCVFCHEFPQKIWQCVSCRNVAACEGCLPAFLAGRAICPLDATTNLADERNRVLLTLPRGVIELSEITTSILYPDDQIILQVAAQNVVADRHEPDVPVADP